jgi:vitamin B12 transporter
MKIKTPASTMLALSVVTSPVAVHAADQTEPVIVTATRTAQIADESVAPVIVIDSQTLMQNPGADLADVLRMYSGIEISRNGGPGHTTSMFIRGAESNHTLVMIDGVKINPGTIGGAALQNIDLSMIDHIEVVKGPRSTLYGSEAIGGVINIITKRRKTDGSDYSAAVGGGSYATKELRLSAHNHKDDRGAGIEASYVKSDGFPTKAVSSIDRGYDNFNLHVYGSKHLGATDYTVSHWQSSGNTEYLDFSNLPVDQDFENATTAIAAKTMMATSWVSTLKLSHISDKIDQNQSSDFAHTSRYAVDWQNDIQWHPQNLLSVGLYRSQENTIASVYGTSFDVDTYVNAAFVQNVRTTRATTLITGLRHTQHETFGDYTTWNFEYGVNLGHALRLTLASNSGFRAPDSTDRYSSSGNPNLKPETSQNSEIGLRYAPTKAQRLSLNVFRNKITDLIEYDSTSMKMKNFAQTTITGSELVYEFLGQHWSARASASVQNPHNDIKDSQLPRRSEHAYSLMLKYRGDNFDVGLDTHYSGNRPDSEYNSHILDPYTLVNLNGDYRFSKILTLNLRIENLTDEDYQLAYGYNTPGRSAYAELRYAM